MRYSIRYEQRGKPRTAEVEANSPNEAMVKFQSIQCPSRSGGGKATARITSVSPTEVTYGP
jgi:hypothetical protein